MKNKQRERNSVVTVFKFINSLRCTSFFNMVAQLAAIFESKPTLVLCP